MELLEQIALCTELGKVSCESPHPASLKGKDGVDELTQKALRAGIDPGLILRDGFMVGMNRIGEKFGRNEVFVPDLLVAARAMNVGLERLQPLLEAGATQNKGVFVIGTVEGDLHDIGKNLVGMVIKGGGWRIVDVGIDTSTEQFLEAIEANPGCTVGLSALLTTTMASMEKTVKVIKQNFPETTVLIGGAPVSREFGDEIGADFYARDPQTALNWLSEKYT